ncbi:MAG: ABC transporter permease [Gemmatimonadota bacterium]
MSRETGNQRAGDAGSRRGAQAEQQATGDGGSSAPGNGLRASFRRIGHMVRKEFRQMFRDPRLKRLIFVAPIVQLVVFGYAVNTDVRNASTFVVDLDHTMESRALIDALTASGYFRVTARSDRPGDMTEALNKGHAILGLEIPAGFAKDVAARRANVQLVVDGTNSNTATVAQGNALRIIQQFAAGAGGGGGGQTAGGGMGGGGVGGASATAAGATAPPPGVDLRTRAWYNPDLASRVYNVPAVIGVILMLMSLVLTSLAVVREREIGTLEQLTVTPLTPTELMLGKTLPVAVVAFIDLVIITLVAVLWFGIPFEGSALALLLAALVYILAGLSFGLLISTVSRTQQEAFMALFLLFMPAIILSGFMFPIFTMPRVFQWLTLLNPIRYFLEIVRGIFLKGDGLRDLWPQYLALAVMAAVALRAAVWRFRRAVA